MAIKTAKKKTTEKAPRKTPAKSKVKAKAKKVVTKVAITPTVKATPTSTKIDHSKLIIEGLRQNNLKNISLSIPHDKITAVVGPSGSGKSSLAFDTLFAEGRWRFMESLSTYTRLFLERMERPELDSIKNVRPTIAIEQKNPVRTSRSTVGTATELNDHLRILFARIGVPHCPDCGKIIKGQSPASVAKELLKKYNGARAYIGFSSEIKITKTEPVDKIFNDLIVRGYIRIIFNNEVFDISEADAGDGNYPKLKKSTKTIDIIADRLVIDNDSRGRLVESIELAFREGLGSMWVVISGENKMNKILFSRQPRCEDCDINLENLTPLLFSFNHPIGACPECKGFGNILRYDKEKVIPDKDKTLREGAIEPWTKPSHLWWADEMARFAEKNRLSLDKKFSKLSKRELQMVFEGTEDFDGIDGFFNYLETKKYKLHIRVFLSRYKSQFICTKCSGVRLKDSALAVKLGKKNIAEITSMTLTEALAFFKALKLSTPEAKVAKEALTQITLKLEFLCETGLGYLTLMRQTRTLSGGEAQRVTLTNQLAGGLSGVLYVLDEPSIGLHARDIDILIEQIERLKARGNTIILVEHDATMIKAADEVVELGPGSGTLGGRLVYTGGTKEFLKEDKTITAKYLTGTEEIAIPHWRRSGKNGEITLIGANANNLKNIDLKIPLKTLSCITGVSGSGKSTLVMDTLYDELAARFLIKGSKKPPTQGNSQNLKSLNINGKISGVRLINQDPIGKTPRSNPITYIGGFDEIRKLFASLRSAKAAGLMAGDFSFNVPGGRCEKCKGEGVEKLEMYFLPDVYVVCAGCNGKRYKTQVLEVRHKRKNINDILAMTFDEAYGFFYKLPKLTAKLSMIREVGLGYLCLGQSAVTLSGGEAQRLKIAKELGGVYSKNPDSEDGGHLYILDEPTTGLHQNDIKKLLSVLGKLVDSGATVIVVEHNMELIKTADYIIDLGPEGGSAGGEVIATGTPEEVSKNKKSHTGRFLKEILKSGVG